MTPAPLSFLAPENALDFRVTHKKNVTWILDNGLHCRNAAVRDPNFVEIGLSDLIARRASREVPIAPAGELSDYVAFYFTPRSVMLYKIVTGHGVSLIPRQDLVILVTSLNLLLQLNTRFLITDRHAVLKLAEFTASLEGLAKIDLENPATKQLLARSR